MGQIYDFLAAIVCFGSMSLICYFYLKMHIIAFKLGWKLTKQTWTMTFPKKNSIQYLNYQVMKEYLK